MAHKNTIYHPSGSEHIECSFEIIVRLEIPFLTYLFVIHGTNILICSENIIRSADLYHFQPEQGAFRNFIIPERAGNPKR
jgi:hypothetical protein